MRKLVFRDFMTHWPKLYKVVFDDLRVVQICNSFVQNLHK